MSSSSFKPNHHDKSICLIIDNIIKDRVELKIMTIKNKNFVNYTSRKLELNGVKIELLKK